MAESSRPAAGMPRRGDIRIDGAGFTIDVTSAGTRGQAGRTTDLFDPEQCED